MPHLQKLYARLRSKGLEIIGVNVGDGKENIQQYVASAKLTFPIGMDREEDLEKPPTSGVAESYRVTGVPSTYVIDARGAVVFRTAGLDFAGLAAALKQLGLE